ncbi:MAG: peptidoglycan DD-metalloendopeptidase family protein [Candidatus Zambryskibacteria bacterium]|nr:peptidoglycan DD-metalloendopeptidase family protein [Candidatus Zambryskibacteria bacterium]
MRARFKINDLRFKNGAFVIILILTTLILLPTTTFAVDPNQLSVQIEAIRRDREALVVEQRRLQAELEAVNRETQTLGSAVKSLDATRRKLAADISITNSKISSTDLNIRMLETTMEEKESQINTHEKAIGLAIQTIYHHDSRPLWLGMLSSSSFSDVWRDRTQLEGLALDLQSEVESLRQTKSILNKEKQMKEEAKKEIVNLQGELAGQKSVVEESKRAKERLLSETQAKEAAYQRMLTDNLARQKQFEEDLFKLESELKIILDPTLIPQARPGVLSWPLDKIYITQRFGKTSASGRLYASGTHNGVDFRAAQGTRVKAVLGGVVEGTGNTDEQKGCGSYGRWVLIKHGNGLTSVYAHLSATLVNAGQSVTTGQAIGYSGGTPGYFGSGYSTGPHLHLGLFASQGVSIRQFTQSRGCKQMYVPIADVKAYLDPLVYLPAI